MNINKPNPQFVQVVNESGDILYILEFDGLEYFKTYSAIHEETCLTSEPAHVKIG